MFEDYFRLAFRNLRKRGVRSWLTLLGIFIGIMAVVSLISLGNGLQIAISSQFGLSSTELISVQAGGLSFGPPGGSVSDPLTIGDVEAIKKLSSVKQAVRRNLEPGQIEFNDKVIFGFATNVGDGEDRDFLYDQLGSEAISGRLLEDGEYGKVLLGYNFYVDKVGLEKEIRVGNKVLIEGKKFEVVGVLDKQGSMIFDNLVLLNEEDAQKLFEYGDDVDIIGVLSRDKTDLAGTKEDIEKLLRERRDVKAGKEDFEVSTPEASLDQVNGILDGVKIFIAIVASISILIGAIGIINTMTTSVLERRREIGIMKAIGARNENIFFQFFVESSLLGLMGGIAGALFGTILGFIGTMGINAWIGTDVQPAISFSLIFFSLVGSFLLGGLAGISPAMKAARENPVEALRG
jgi:putative ABC transport system permease protein